MGVAVGLAAAAAVLTGLCVTTLDTANTSLPDGWVVTIAVGTCILLILIPAIVLIVYHPRLRRWYHAALLAVLYGYLAPVITTSATAIVDRVPSWVWFQVLWRSLLFALISAALLVPLWAVARAARGRLLITNKTMCPTCGYNLLGNTNHVCPECGEPFTLEEMEITTEELQSYDA